MSIACRNVVTIAPKGTGKTTLVEAALFAAGAIENMGTIGGGDTVADFDPEEAEREMSLFPSICTLKWNNRNVHIVDTAGYPDLIGESRAVAGLMDNAVMPVNGVEGVKSHAVKIWKFLVDNNISRFVFINEMDKDNASFDNAWQSLRKTLNFPFVPITLPLVKDGKLAGVIDLIKGRALAAPSGGGGKYAEEDVPEDASADFEKYRESLIEAAAEMDDSLMEKYLDGEEVGADELAKNVRAGTVEGKLCPVLCGSALKNIGVAQLLDYFLEFSASPEDRGNVKAKDADDNEVERKPHENEQFSAQVFKTMIDQYAGKISVFRVFSGTLKPDSTVRNTRAMRKERIAQVYHICGKKQTTVPSVGPGDIAAVVKLQETSTGDTLAGVDSAVVFPRLALPEPALSVAIHPKDRGDEDKLSTGLSRIREEDPLMQLSRHEQTKELTISGMGQMHVDSIVSRLKRRFSIEVSASTPQVPYRETIRRKVQVQGKYKKQSGGRGQYGDVRLELEPLPRGEGFEFVNKIFGGAVPRNYIPAVEKGCVEKMAQGAIAGYPIVDMKVTIYDGTYHDVDSSDMAFKIASSMAITKGVREADPAVLEPVMSVEVEVPEENMGDIIGDLNGRRGKVTTIDDGPGVKIVKATVPQAEMLRYAPDLNSITSGRGTYTMELDHFEVVPKKIRDEIIGRYERQKKEEE